MGIEALFKVQWNQLKGWTSAEMKVPSFTSILYKQPQKPYITLTPYTIHTHLATSDIVCMVIQSPCLQSIL